MAKDTEREIVQHLDQAFAELIASLKDLASLDHNVLRSAAVIEQMCGGLVSNLWDDPFEWTLPETLSNPDRVNEYLSEVDRARQTAFNSIRDDGALTKYISTPTGERQLVSLLLETLIRASDYRGRAARAKK